MYHFYLMLFGLSMVISTLPLLYGKRTFAKTCFTLTGYGTAVWILAIHQLWNSEYTLFWARTAFFGGGFWPIMLLLFIKNYPERDRSISWRQLALLCLPALAMEIAAYTPFIVNSIAPNRQIEYGFGHKLFSVYYFIYLAIYFKIAYQKIREYSGLERLRLQYITYSSTLFIGGLSITNMILPILGTNQYNKFGPLFSSFFVGAILYSIAKYRLMDIKLILKKGAVYISLISIVTVLFSTLVYYSEKLLRSFVGAPGIYSTVFASSAIILIYPRVRALVDRITDSIFFRKRYNAQEALKKLSFTLNSTIDIEDIYMTLSYVLPKIMKIQNSALYYRAGQSPTFVNRGQVYNYESEAVDRPKSINISHPIFRELRETQSVLIRDEFKFLMNQHADPKAKVLFDAMKAIDCYVAAPVLVGTKLVAVLVLGQKLSEESYFEEDVALLQTILNQASTAIQNAYHYHQLQDNVKELKKAGAFNRELLENMDTGVIMTNRELIVKSVNKKAAALLGKKKADLVGNPITKFTRSAPGLKLFRKTVESNTKHTEESMIEHDQLIPVAISTDTISNMPTGEEGIIGIISDLSPVKELQKQVEQSEKMSSLGTMAAGIAHEIKNPLVAIKTFSQMLPKKGEKPEFREKYSRIVLPQIQKINDMCQSLLRLGRPQKSTFACVNLSEVVREVSLLLEGESKTYGGTIHFDSASDVYVHGDHSQLMQVLLNLLMNSLQSFKKEVGGTIMVKIGRSDGMAHLSITDSGCGMSQDQVRKIFNPFFTTKDTGTGLGMSIVFKIIEDHKGKITVASKKGHGTMFDIRLPLSEELPKKPEAKVKDYTVHLNPDKEATALSAS